jgi:hypothetical protein
MPVFFRGHHVTIIIGFDLISTRPINFPTTTCKECTEFSETILSVFNCNGCYFHGSSGGDHIKVHKKGKIEISFKLEPDWLTWRTPQIIGCNTDYLITNKKNVEGLSYSYMWYNDSPEKINLTPNDASALIRLKPGYSPNKDDFAVVQVKYRETEWEQHLWSVRKFVIPIATKYSAEINWDLPILVDPNEHQIFIEVNTIPECAENIAGVEWTVKGESEPPFPLFDIINEKKIKLKAYIFNYKKEDITPAVDEYWKDKFSVVDLSPYNKRSLLNCFQVTGFIVTAIPNFEEKFKWDSDGKFKYIYNIIAKIHFTDGTTKVVNRQFIIHHLKWLIKEYNYWNPATDDWDWGRLYSHGV